MTDNGLGIYLQSLPVGMTGITSLYSSCKLRVIEQGLPLVGAGGLKGEHGGQCEAAPEERSGGQFHARH